MQGLLRTLVHLQVVMPNHRCRGIDQAVVHQGALEQQIGRAHQAKGPRLDQGAIRRQGFEDAQRLDRPLDHDVGEINGIVAHLTQNLLRPLFAISRLHLVPIAGHRRISGVDGVGRAGVPMAIGPTADAHALEKLVRADEGRKQLDRHGLGRALGGRLPHLDRRAGRGFMRHHGVAGIGLVVDQHLPVAAVHVAQHPTGHFELALG